MPVEQMILEKDYLSTQILKIPAFGGKI